MSNVVTPDLTAFWEAKTERYCQLAAACALIYEYFITWDLEVELFWKRRWSFGKIIFLFSRYYSLAFNTTNAIVFNQDHATMDVGTKFFQWQNTGASVQVIVTHVILELRLYAMYGSARWILILFIAMTCGEGIMLGVVIGMPIVGSRDTNEPSPGLYICADGDPVNRHWISYYWSSLIIAESVFLSLGLYKGYSNWKTGDGGPLMMALTRDSVLYFICIFVIYIANQVIWLRNDITLNEVATGFSFCITVILANRLMLAVRVRYYLPEEEYDEDGGISLHFINSSAQWSRLITSWSMRDGQILTEDDDRRGHIELETIDEQ